MCGYPGKNINTPENVDLHRCSISIFYIYINYIYLFTLFPLWMVFNCWLFRPQILVVNPPISDGHAPSFDA